MTIAEAVQQLKHKNFCLEVTSNGYQLRTSHEYWYQVQGQLLVTGAPFCLFIVYTNKNLWSSVIQPDQYTMTSMLPKLARFYQAHIHSPRNAAMHLEMDTPQCSQYSTEHTASCQPDSPHR